MSAFNQLINFITCLRVEQVIINDAIQAESLIACGMLRRATAATNSNSQSRFVSGLPFLWLQYLHS